MNETLNKVDIYDGLIGNKGLGS